MSASRNNVPLTGVVRCIPVLTALTPAFSELLTARGEGLLSGLLVDQAPQLTAHLESHGWQVTTEAEQGRWALLAIRRA